MRNSYSYYNSSPVTTREVEQLLRLEIKRIKRRLNEITVTRRYEELGDIAVNILIIDLLVQEQGLQDRYEEAVLELKKLFKRLVIVRETNRLLLVKRKAVKKVLRRHEAP